jgi:hypothetical protein
MQKWNEPGGRATVESNRTLCSMSYEEEDTCMSYEEEDT